MPRPWLNRSQTKELFAPVSPTELWFVNAHLAITFQKAGGKPSAPSPRTHAAHAARKDSWGNLSGFGKAFVDSPLDNHSEQQIRIKQLNTVNR